MEPTLIDTDIASDDDGTTSNLVAYVAAPLAVFGAFKAGQSVVRRIRARRAAKAETVDVTPVETE